MSVQNESSSAANIPSNSGRSNRRHDLQYRYGPVEIRDFCSMANKPRMSTIRPPQLHLIKIHSEGTDRSKISRAATHTLCSESKPSKRPVHPDIRLLMLKKETEIRTSVTITTRATTSLPERCPNRVQRPAVSSATTFPRTNGRRTLTGSAIPPPDDKMNFLSRLISVAKKQSRYTYDEYMNPDPEIRVNISLRSRARWYKYAKVCFIIHFLLATE